jgi:predicted DNA-binding transcriptional regulator AlpA
MESEMRTGAIKVGATAGDAQTYGLWQSAEAEIASHRVVSMKEAAAFLGISLPTFKRLRAKGRMPNPVRLSERKLGWRIASLVEFIGQRSA